MKESTVKFDAVLIDMDGTLVDSEPYWLAAETELMARFGYIWTSENQAICLGGPLPRVGRYMAELAGQVGQGEYFTQTLIEMVALHFQAGLSFMPGGLELLEDIANSEIPMALVSASPRILVDAALAALPKPFFKVSISSNDVTESKPHPMGYIEAARRLGGDIENCLVLEDSLTGVTAGLASEAKVVAIPHIVQFEPHPNMRIVDSLSGASLESLANLFR
jgi:HAD superfamily hydrolase (TIGR01509 family)